jgi:16S rRNA processing protein RimM
VSGDLIFHIDADYPEDYIDLDSVFVEIKGNLVPYFIEDFNLHKTDKAIVTLEGVDTIEKAQALVGSALYLPEEALDELEEGQFYYHDIPGYTVVDERLGALGTVITVYTPGSQDLIAMDYKGFEVLIPVVDDIVISADHEKKQVLVNLPEGLVDVYLDEVKPEEMDGDEN